MRPQQIGPIALSLLLACLLGCSGDDCPTCPEDELVISVSPGTIPYFTWCPSDDLFSVLLVETTERSNQWCVNAYGGNMIASGVEYGVVPPVAVETIEAVPLEQGTEYRIVLFQRGSSGNVPAGSQTFTP